MAHSRKLWKLCFMLAFLSAAFPALADCTTSAPNGGSVNGQSLWGEVPLSGSASLAPDCDVNQFAWNNFLYMTGNDSSGHPRFMSLAPWYDAMPIAGKPVWKGTYTPLQAGQMLDSTNKLQAGDGFHLLDANGKTVTYDIRVNEAIVNYVAENGMYTQQAIAKAAAAFNAAPSTGGIWLPPASANPDGSALEVKTSWRNFGNKAGRCPSSIMLCEKDSAGTWWGLLGMHLVQKTPKHGEMIWASFEHIANAPDCATGGSNPIAQNPGSLNVNKNIPGLKDKTGWSLFNYASYEKDGGGGNDKTGKTCTYPTTGTQKSQCLNNPNPSGDNKTWVTVNVCRTDKLPPASATGCKNAASDPLAVSCLNESVQASLSSVWKNYQLVGAAYVKWPPALNAGAPDTGCWNFEDGDASLNCITGSNQGYMTVLRQGTLNLANATMETWMQKGINLVTPNPHVGTLTQQDCFSCHQPTTASYQGDMSHLFDRAQQIGDVEAGPIWNNSDARHKCPSVCSKAGGKWNGQWTTTEPGQMSVCGCVVANQP